MTLTARHHIELYGACHRLLDALTPSARALEVAHQPLLARELRIAGAALVTALRRQDLDLAQQVADRIADDLELALRCAGPEPCHFAATKALAVVQRGLWCPPSRDRPPVIVHTAPPTATSLDEVPA